MLLGHTCVCAVEIEPYCRKVLLQRQRDGILPKFPIWDDVRTFDGRPWRGLVDVVCGGFPCQDISCAGKGVGIDGDRSGLWSEMSRVIGEVQPVFAFVENSSMLTVRGIDRVLGDLAEMGFNAKWGVYGGCNIGAPHERKRMWIHASNTDRNRLEKDSDKSVLCKPKHNSRSTGRFSKVGCSSVWLRPRPIGARPMGMGDGLAGELDRIKACGNGQIPSVVALAWNTLAGIK